MRSAILLVALLAAPPAVAHEQLHVAPAVDVPITSAAIALWLLPAPKVPVAYDPGEPPGGLDGIAPLHVNDGLGTASDVTMQVAVWGSALATGIDGALDGDLAGRLLLQLEAMAITGAFTSIAKAAAGRPRPFTYGRHQVRAPNDEVSFFSGHTSSAAAATFAAARGLDLTGDPGTAGRILLYGGATAITAAVGVLRVSAGQHFPTDVIAGAVVGGAVGFLVPELHRVLPAVAIGGGFRELSVAVRF